MSNLDWPIEREMLYVRFSCLRLSNFITKVSFTELLALYVHLIKLAGA